MLAMAAPTPDEPEAIFVLNSFEARIAKKKRNGSYPLELASGPIPGMIIKADRKSARICLQKHSETGGDSCGKRDCLVYGMELFGSVVAREALALRPLEGL